MNDDTLFDDLDGALRSSRGQHRLTGIQLVNWGTFANHHRIDVAEKGFLITGASGSGKSTILDAISVVLVRPKDLNLNAAAGDAGQRVRDRTVLSYLRGSWSINADEITGEVATQQLRPGTTWSAIALDYSDGKGVETTLVRVFWAARGVTDPGGVKSVNLIADRRFDLKELEPVLADGLSLRTVKALLSPWYAGDQYPAFQEKFARRLGIGGERALRLLHKTQATKGLTSLDSLLRDFMLDEPETFAIASRMVEQFDELSAAHEAVQTARKQVAHLEPVRGLDAELGLLSVRAADLEAEIEATDWYVTERAIALHHDEIARAQRDRTDAAAEQTTLEADLSLINDRIDVLREQHLTAGGGRLDGIRSERDQAAGELSSRTRRQSALRSHLTVLGAATPSTQGDHAELVNQARTEIDALAAGGADVDREQYDAFAGAENARRKLDSVRAEMATLAMSRSNINGDDLRLRDELAAAARVDPKRLPFVAELLDVPEEHAEWRGAIERLLGGFARSVLIPESVYAAASAYIDSTHLGRKLLYYRVPREVTQKPRAIGPDSVVHRIDVADSTAAEWLHAELSQRFDYACTESLAEFQRADKGLTRNGQVRHGSSRHEKNDRSRIDDRRQWVLGFDNAAKQQLFAADAQRLQTELDTAEKQVTAVLGRRTAAQARLDACHRIVETPWDDIDTASAAQRLHGLDQLIAEFASTHRDLARLDEQIASQRAESTALEQTLRAAGARVHAASTELERLARGLDERQATRAQLQPAEATALARLESRFAARSRSLTLDRLGDLRADVQKEISSEATVVERSIRSIRERLTQLFTEFKAEWTAEAADVDTDVEATGEYLRILERIEHDGLPQFETKFLNMLQDLSTMSLGQLRRQIDQERRQIRDRITPINESLALSEYGHGTILRIDVKERQLALVNDFKKDVAAATDESLVNDPARATERFEILRRLVTRFGSPEPEHRHWRDQVLDVRRHVEFEAREIGEGGETVEIHTSGAGRSGGQRVKLVTFALAAALRYQLGGRGGERPDYGTVVIDEAFDKADADFTEKSMRIFEQFGFQMVLATPMKLIQTLSPFIGGATVIHIRDRKESSAFPIDLVELTATPSQQRADALDR
ncbi:MAG: AAA family ATPase [Microbacteriaceae bacterium]|nr:AAA family ATPase [Microbacteriaceae bacterium]